VAALPGGLARIPAAAVGVAVLLHGNRPQLLPAEVHAVHQPGAGQQIAKEQKQTNETLHAKKDHKGQKMATKYGGKSQGL
jgi:hypothetical protein